MDFVFPGTKREPPGTKKESQNEVILHPKSDFLSVVVFDVLFECYVFLLCCDFGCPEAPFWDAFCLIYGRSEPLQHVMGNLYEKLSKNEHVF